MTLLQGIMFLFAAPLLIAAIAMCWFVIRDLLEEHPNESLVREDWGSWHCFEPGEPCGPDDPCSELCGRVVGVTR